MGKLQEHPDLHGYLIKLQARNCKVGDSRSPAKD